MNSLSIDPGAYSRMTYTYKGKRITCRQYEKICYVRKPTDQVFHVLNIFVPEVCFHSQGRVPVFMPTNVGGYMPAEAGYPNGDACEKPNAAAAALAEGYIVVYPAIHGSTNKGEDGLMTGKAPACVVDLKAAIRFVRHNQETLPWDTEKIITNGTSAGGALSLLVAVSGNDQRFQPYLEAVGAADGRDDIYAGSCYCPITDLDHADMAYEWMYGDVPIDQGTDYYRHFTGVEGDLKTSLIQGCQKDFVDYLNGV